ncbi:MAG: adenylate/guanylate cyclase domain-containing protein [Spirochaetia bacterium]|jgi:adenylate cyclase|nr:adenylate/guanylate cyclase domain-containing protein [Spirochaetia bacterium]
MSVLKNVFIAVAAGVFFALLYAAGVLDPLEERVYDFFLKGRPERERIDNVVFLDVDDAAITYHGVFPWPRAVMADGFLRLKEYGVSAAILDIEFIDKGPAGIDEIYFTRDFPADFDRTFSQIGSNVSDLLQALRGGRIGGREAARYEEELLALIWNDGRELFQKTSGIARNNDTYLAQASALFGHTWATLNLQGQTLADEQAERRSHAEKNFSYQVDAAPNIRDSDFADVLPPIASFAEAARGAGFTNVFIDADGVRRRIFLAQKIRGHFYLQLAFAPLMEYLGRPGIRLEKRRLILQNARHPGGGGERDIAIPLDARGRMMLDWPKTDYRDSFAHVSFAELSHLEYLESQIEKYRAALEAAQFAFFAQFDESLVEAPHAISQGGGLLRESREALGRALAEKSDDWFSRRLALRGQGMALLQSFVEQGAGAKVRALAQALARDYPQEAGKIGEEAEYIAQTAEYLASALRQYAELQERLAGMFAGKFCIVGRVDTGTTDIGVNPFYGEYVNVGTHAVVLDTVLRESFLIPVDILWSVALCPLLALVLMLALRRFAPTVRAGLGLGGVLLFALACFAVFRYWGVFLAPLGPALAALIAVIARELVSYMASEKEKQFINRALSTYVSKEVVEELVANPSLLQLGGSKRHISAIFTDIQGFSTISEQLDPEQLVQLLNRYLTRMSDIIMENMGTIDKYEGDAIIAFFGAPVYRPDHAALVCRSAIQMKKAEAELNRSVVGEGLITGGVLAALRDKGVRLDPENPAPLYTRMGINTGEMVVGNMGTSSKMNYTIMGNAVNLAARLEGVNKQYHTGGMLISEYTRNEIGEEFLCRRLDRVRVVGVHTPLRLYELLALRADAPESLVDARAAWEQALDLYENRAFQAAGEIFHSLAERDENDGAARLYADACRAYAAEPPAADWDGVNNLTQK